MMFLQDIERIMTFFQPVETELQMFSFSLKSKSTSCKNSIFSVSLESEVLDSMQPDAGSAHLQIAAAAAAHPSSIWF